MFRFSFGITTSGIAYNGLVSSRDSLSRLGRPADGFIE
jgi:hypothetical protein